MIHAPATIRKVGEKEWKQGNRTKLHYNKFNSGQKTHEYRKDGCRLEPITTIWWSLMCQVLKEWVNNEPVAVEDVRWGSRTCEWYRLAAEGEGCCQWAGMRLLPWLIDVRPGPTTLHCKHWDTYLALVLIYQLLHSVQLYNTLWYALPANLPWKSWSMRNCSLLPIECWGYNH